MKTNLLSLSFLFFINSFIFSCSGDCQGCGGCSYENFTSSAVVEKIVVENDSIVQVEFKIDNGDYYTAMKWEIRKLIHFDQENLEDKSARFLIEGERIHKGSCQPYVIENIKLSK